MKQKNSYKIEFLKEIENNPTFKTEFMEKLSTIKQTMNKLVITANKIEKLIDDNNYEEAYSKIEDFNIQLSTLIEKEFDIEEGVE